MQKKIELSYIQVIKLLLVNAVSRCADARVIMLNETIDVLLTDLDLPDGNCTVLISELTGSQPSTPAMVISVCGGEQHVIDSIKDGG